VKVRSANAALELQAKCASGRRYGGRLRGVEKDALGGVRFGAAASVCSEKKQQLGGRRLAAAACRVDFLEWTRHC